MVELECLLSVSIPETFDGVIWIACMRHCPFKSLYIRDKVGR